MLSFLEYFELILMNFSIFAKVRRLGKEKRLEFEISLKMNINFKMQYFNDLLLIIILLNFIKIISTMSITDQLKCKNHPSEFITNYCIKCNHSIDLETCNMELCATCICEHT